MVLVLASTAEAATVVRLAQPPSGPPGRQPRSSLAPASAGVLVDQWKELMPEAKPPELRRRKVT